MPLSNSIAAKIAEPNIIALRNEIGAEDLVALPRDVSPRQYFRGTKGGRKFILMLYPNADKESRAELQHFIDLGQWLNSVGVKAPELYELNSSKAYALFEDLGAHSFGDIIRNDNAKSPDLYQKAIDVLIKLKSAKYKGELPEYKRSKIYENRRQLLEYYVAYVKCEKTTESAISEFTAAWDAIEKSLPPCPQGFVHGDYHLENLMFIAKGNEEKQCALIDFQDALHGPLPYDLLNLLEDARVDVPQKIKNDMINKYCAKMNAKEKENFIKWYTVLAAQFHGRVLGLFIKLAAEQGRDSYLIHIPRLQKYFSKALNDPLLKPLREFFDKEGVDFTPLNALDGQEIRNRFQNM